MRLDISSVATAAAIATAETIDSDAISRSLALLVRYNQITSRKILLARLLQPMHADRAISTHFGATSMTLNGALRVVAPG